MQFHLILLLVLLLGLTSCGTTSPELESINTRNQPIFLNGFSISTPNEFGWYCIRSNTKGNSVSLVRSGDMADEMF